MAMASRYSEQVKQGVESLINCLICTDRFSDPKVLPCQHTFCLPCLEHFYKSYNDQRIISVSNFPCPQCRKSVYMPQGGLTSLPTDFKVGQIQDVFNKINIVGNELTCDVCRYDDKTVQVSSFCAQCSKYLCEACTRQHANSAVFRSHSTVAIGSQHTDDLICSQHKEVVKYYCTGCKVALCTVCALSKHSKHETIDLATAMDRNRTQVVESVHQLKANLLQYENKAEKFAALIRSRQVSADKLKEQVKKQTRAAIARLRENEAQLNAQIDAANKKVESEIDADIAGINNKARDLKAVCDRADSFLANGGSLELINKFDSLIKQLREYADPCSLTVQEHYTQELELSVNEDLNIGCLIIKQSDELQGGEVDKEMSHDGVKHKTRKLAKAPDTDPATESSADKKAFKQARNTQLPVASDSSMPGVVTSPNSSPRETTRHATTSASDSAPSDSQSDQSDGGGGDGACAADEPPVKDKLRLQWRTVDHAQPRDVAFLADGTAVVTEYRDDSDKMQLFDPDGNLIKCVACSAQNIVKPWGCAVNHQLEQIIVTDHGDRAVKVLDKDLTLKHVWRSLFDKPCGIAVMRNGDYVITDVEKAAYMISIHTPGGIRKREFAKKGTGLSDLQRPYYVTADHHDRIIVSDAALNCIKIFDSRGKMLLKFHAANDPPLQPHGVCIDAQNNIVVADQSNNMISLFSSDGQYIKNIARVDDKPWGIAAHDNGSLAITTDPSLHMLYAPIIKTF